MAMQFITNHRRRLQSALPDALDQVIFVIIMASIAFTVAKLIIVYSSYVGDPLLSKVVPLSIIFCTAMAVLLFFQPKYLKLTTKLGLIGMTIYLLAVTITTNNLNAIGLQHMFIILMIAFYGLNRFWGMAFSAILFGFVAVVLMVNQKQFPEFRLFPPIFSFSDSFVVIMLNFLQAAFIHYYYNRTLNATVKEIRDLNLQLNKLLKTRSNFLSAVSHELRTPLNSVIGSTYLLADSEMDESQRKNVQNLKFSAESLLILINDILDFTKMDSNHTRLESIPFSPQEIVENVMNALHGRAEAKFLSVSLEIDEGAKNLYVLGDPSRLQQIIFNLLGNAIKFTNQGGVTVNLYIGSRSDTELTLHIRVTDTGIGIDPDMHHLIFEPFMQASTSINRKFGGTGLGLAIVKHLVNLHNGEIRLKSAPGKGTIFQVELPYVVYLGETPQISDSDKQDTFIGTARMPELRVLLAEDNEMSVLFMKQLLKKWEINVVTVGNGEEAVEAVMTAAEPYHVILMDIHMPKLNGIKAVEQIRQVEQSGSYSSFIIALTASVSDEMIKEFEEYGFDDHLGKPFRPNDLLLKLQIAYNSYNG